MLRKGFSIAMPLLALGLGIIQVPAPRVPSLSAEKRGYNIQIAHASCISSAAAITIRMAMRPLRFGTERPCSMAQGLARPLSVFC